MIDVHVPATFGPPFFPSGIGRLQTASTPRLELLAWYINDCFCRKQYVYVIAPAIHSMQFSAANAAVSDDNSVDDLTLGEIENNGIFCHHQRGFTHMQCIGFA